MNFPRVLMLLVGLFGLILLVVALISLTNDGSVAFIAGRKYGGFFLVIVSLLITAGGFVGFLRMKSR